MRDNKGKFVRGTAIGIRTQIKRGQRLSPHTEFKSGRHIPVLPIGSVRVRTNHSTGERRAWVKIAEPNKWKQRSRLVWEAAHGPIDSTIVVHHKDRDTLNDDLSNLSAQTRREHLAEHRKEVLGARF